MNNIRRDLINNTYYLGVPAIRDEVTWRKMGRENTLVTADSAAAEDALTKNTGTSKTVDTTGEGSTKSQSDKSQSNTSTLLVPASLTFVALLSPEGFFLAPDGNWTRSTNFAPTFADVKLNCRAIAPSDVETFADDFTSVMQNIEWLMAQTETPGNTKQGVLTSNESPKISIKMRHVLFEVCRPYLSFALRS